MIPIVIIILCVPLVCFTFGILGSDWQIEQASTIELWAEMNRQIRFVLVVEAAVVIACVAAITVLAVLA